VGIDAYGENEALIINLANSGVELPYTIQKTIYDSNVHEDNVDHILINRKFKELLSNYWDILANKGSYKSLLNSIKWFEWGEQLEIKEIYKHYNAGITFYNDTEFLSSFKDSFKKHIDNFIKTNYISLYVSLYNELPTYDNEYNPEIEQKVFKWAKEDIQLKIALLSQFFEIYFMPVHMGVLAATVEDIVFTNTIKAIHTNNTYKDDYFYSFDCVHCNIINNPVFKLTNVSAQTTKHTVYKLVDSQYEGQCLFGVDPFPKNTIINVKDTSIQYYTGPGAIIPINMIINNQVNGDFIKQTIVDYVDDNNESKRIFLYDIFKVLDNKIDINFNLLVKTAKAYELRFTFILGSSKTITHTIKFTVEDADNLNINIYKICAKNDSLGFTKSDFMNTDYNNYMFKIQNTPSNNLYTQYLQYMPVEHPNFKKYNGIKLNRTIVVNLQDDESGIIAYDNQFIKVLRGIMYNDFLEYAKYLIDDNGEFVLDNNGKPIIKYLIYISKKFYQETPKALYDNIYSYKFSYNIIRNDLSFYPQFHYLKKIEGSSINDYTITEFDSLCCAAEINDGNTVKPFKYGNSITGAEWVFTNTSDNNIIYQPGSSQQPFIASDTLNRMEKGYYDITFKYSLTNGVSNECKLCSAFRIK
jgi:hypothetical protein